MLTIQTAYLFIYLLSNYYVPRTKLAAENRKLLDVRIRFQINEKKYMGLQNETVILNFGNQNLFQNENCLPGKRKQKQQQAKTINKVKKSL